MSKFETFYMDRQDKPDFLKVIGNNVKKNLSGLKKTRELAIILTVGKSAYVPPRDSGV